jgi:hypothetical protein
MSTHASLSSSTLTRWKWSAPKRGDSELARCVAYCKQLPWVCTRVPLVGSRWCTHTLPQPYTVVATSTVVVATLSAKYFTDVDFAGVRLGTKPQAPSSGAVSPLSPTSKPLSPSTPFFPAGWVPVALADSGGNACLVLLLR